MAESDFSRQYLNWPDAVESKLPYKAPPKGSNPAIKGILLSLSAPLVEKVSFISTFLYNNAGFNSLRKVNLDDIKHRYDPTVSPVGSSEDRNAPAPNYTDPSGEIRSLLKSVDGQPMYWSVRDYHAAYKSGELTPTQVVKALLPLIRRDVEPRSEFSTSFLFTKVNIVLAAAEASTKRWAEGKSLGLLDGVPIAIKDEVDLADYPQKLGSKRFIRECSKETSWCVTKWEEQGVVVMGKTNMHEVGMDTTNNNYVTGTPKNPYNDRYYTGGSSGGSAYAVSTGLIPFALGTDGGGSIRIPSNYCGVFGLKTSHSRVSCHPSPDVAGTTAVAGPIAARMEDLEIAYRVMATPDPRKHVSAMFPNPRPLSAPRKKILGIPRQWFDQADTEVRITCQAAVDWMVKEQGYEVIDINLPLLNEGQTAHALTILLEVRTEMKDTTFLQPANRILMALAAKCPSTDFLSAQKVRQVLMQHLAYLWETHGKDLIIVTPTTPNAGWHFKPADLKRGISDGDMTVKSMAYVWMANFTGCPCIQFPVGYMNPVVGEGKVPIGIMGMGIWGSEEELIEWGYEGEKYLHEVVKGGRLRSPKWVDLINLTKKGEEKHEGQAPVNGINGTNAPNGTSATVAKDVEKVDQVAEEKEKESSQPPIKDSEPSNPPAIAGDPTAKPS